jgi:hypothetical protein
MPWICWHRNTENTRVAKLEKQKQHQLVEQTTENEQQKQHTWGTSSAETT